MGLGKTLQAISLLSYLKVHEMSPGPFCKLRIFCVLKIMECSFLALVWSLDRDVFWLPYLHSITCSHNVSSERDRWLGVRDS